MRLLYPSDPIDPKRVDEAFLDEFEAARAEGFETSLFSFEDFESGEFRARPAFQPDDVVLYRGWMLSIPMYRRLVAGIESKAARPLTTVEQYHRSHHLPEWYPTLGDLTSETIVLAEDADFVEALADHDWPGYFIKDYVKSLSTAGGSLASSATEIAARVALMKEYRGVIEGGVCVRRKEEYVPGSERRYFVINGCSHSTDDDVPELVSICASRIESPFFSVDVARRSDGVLRLIEIGDGQVSDRKEWGAEQFVRMLASAGE